MGSRLDELKRKLAAREGKSEYKDNCMALRAEIARLEANEVGVRLPQSGGHL